MNSRSLWVFILSSLASQAFGTGHIQPECDPITEWKKNESDCLREIQQHRNDTTGCKVLWDELLCWPDANPGQTLIFDCPAVIVHFTKKRGWVKRNCTAQGWTDPSPPYSVACPLEEEIIRDGEIEMEQFYLATVKTVYTVGYGVSTASLAIAVVVLISFRRLRCPRNYIHIHLFLTFILKAVAIFVRDLVVFQTEGTDYCSFSTSQCKISVVFSHYFMMTNFMWLLVEALYLNCLLLSSFPHGRKYFWWLVLFGWGVPTFFTTVWILVKVHFEDTACWDINDNSPYWWLIKGPIVFSVAVNFGLFINIIRILLKKLNPRRMNFSHSSQYRRLSKSTLLLIPLFGTHCIIFNFLPEGEHAHVGIRLYLELCIGSFQGFLVAVLYCFLNKEVNHRLLFQYASNIRAGGDLKGASRNLPEMARQRLRIDGRLEEEDQVDHAVEFRDQNVDICV